MAKTAVLAIDIVGDASDATKAFDDAGKAAGSAAEKIDTVGGRAGDTASGLSALSGALDAAGFGGAATALTGVATAMDAAEGSTILFKVAQESLSLTTIKDTAARIANTVATTAASAASKTWAAVQWLLNAALTANPIGLIIAAIVILIGIIVLIATKTTWFQDLWAVAWGAIQSAAVAVWDFIVTAAQAAWKLIVAGVKFYINIWISIFNVIRDAVGAVWDWIVSAAQAAWNLIKASIATFAAGAQAIWDGIKDAVGTVWDGIESAAKSALDAVLIPINAVKTAFDKVVQAVKDVIEWLKKIKVPDAIGKIGDVIGGINPFTAGGGTAPGLSSQAMTRATGTGGGVTINMFVPESSDPVATSRYVKALIRRGEAAGVVFGTT